MTNMLATGADWLSAQLQSHASEAVVYSRGAQSVTVAAVIGQSEETAVDTNGMILVVRHCDFLIPKAALTFGAGAIEPQPGDRITRGSGAVWQVQPTSDGRGYREAANGIDPDWRIHAKRVS